MTIARIEEVICAHICEREPTDPASYADLLKATLPMLTPMVRLDQILAGMIDTGQIETFEDEERGTVYVRDC